ncbi:chemotaxis protein CheW [Chachezhania sediminis]|uniref:chemotaxis protein CheW n=1 Tax=Chachezhania sediminis TaxID=2599291 RepID=UPI00131C8C08|nr:chemotaxis protein CheW [Chachezhania sediminis]
MTSQTHPAGDAPHAAYDGYDNLLIFRLEGEAFAVSVKGVHEILDPQSPTIVPNAPRHSPGLINVRGVVVPVFDIRHRLGMGAGTKQATSRMIVFEHEIDGEAGRLAFSADSVEEVHEADLAGLEPIPELGAIWPQACLEGAIRRNGELVVLLNTDVLFSPQGDGDATQTKGA